MTLKSDRFGNTAKLSVCLNTKSGLVVHKSRDVPLKMRVLKVPYSYFRENSQKQSVFVALIVGFLCYAPVGALYTCHFRKRSNEKMPHIYQNLAAWFEDCLIQSVNTA